MRRARVVVADRDPLWRRAVCAALRAGGMVVAGEAGDGIEAVELALQHRPDVALLEAGLERMDAIEATRRIHRRAPGVRIVLLTPDADADRQVEALVAGASGSLCRTTALEGMVTALRGVMQDEAAVSRELATRLVGRLRALPHAGMGMRPVRSPLTAREWEVLDLMSRGARPRDVAGALHLSEETVNSHLKNVMRKLGVHSRAEAIEAADRLCRASRPGGEMATGTVARGDGTIGTF